jgi:hypothetical protein
MKIRLCFICLLILCAFSGHTGLTQNPRDLTRYDDGGAFDFNWGAGSASEPRNPTPVFRIKVPSARNYPSRSSFLRGLNIRANAPWLEFRPAAYRLSIRERP